MAATRTKTDTQNKVNVVNVTHTYTAANLGTAQSNRSIVVAIQIEANGGLGTISSVVINGVTATSIVQITVGAPNERAALFAADVPSGATGDISITNSLALFASTITVYACYGMSITPTDTGTDNDSNPATFALDIAAGGVAFGSVIHRSNTDPTTFTWGNLTEDTDQVMTVNDEYVTAASAEFASAQTNLSISCTSSNAGVRSPGMCVASFPAASQNLSLTAAAGSYAYTGMSAAVGRLLILTAAAGAYTYTGAAALFPIGRMLFAAVGAYAYTGQTVILNSVRTFFVQGGTYAYTGMAATLSKVKILTAEAGAYAVSGYAIVLARAISVGQFLKKRFQLPRLYSQRRKPPQLGD